MNSTKPHGEFAFTAPFPFPLVPVPFPPSPPPAPGALPLPCPVDVPVPAPAACGFAYFPLVALAIALCAPPPRCRAGRPFARPAICCTGAGVLCGGGVTRGSGVGGCVGRGVGVGLGVGRGRGVGRGVSKTMRVATASRSVSSAGLGVHETEEDLVQGDGERDRDDHAIAMALEVDHWLSLRPKKKATPGGVARSSVSVRR